MTTLVVAGPAERLLRRGRLACVAAGHHNCLVTTCGSGIGAKLFVGGRPTLGGAGMRGEI